MMDYISFDLCEIPFGILAIGFANVTYPLIIAAVVWKIYCALCSTSNNFPADLPTLDESANDESTNDDPLQIQARRWFKQAELDYRASAHDFDSTEPAYEWVCFKCIQALKKACKSVEFVTNYNNLKSTRISKEEQAARATQMDTLTTHIRELTGPPNRMLFPEDSDDETVPRDLFNQSQAENVVTATKDLLDYVNQSYIHV